ncbi:hypothetical protein [Tautonia rosea]|uniref:hypothetical protein n=1 Tax=Tautonia rosea TaxID=2728037 RepID=UPI001473E1DF|nr:hypothetical protein [Tautonia rosea]
MTDATRTRGRPPSERKRTGQVKIRCFEEWADWLRSASDQTGQDAAEIIAEAVAAWAKRKKLPAPPER